MEGGAAQASAGRGVRTAFWTLPARMQLVHTSMRRVDPPTTARTRWMFGFQRRLVRRCEWLMRMPNCGYLPHTSQTDAMTETLLS